MARIDLAGIDREQFSVSERNGRFLITPLKSKHVWAESELHLRSLLVNADGDVLSSGFPKFVNYGENKEHDKTFRLSLGYGTVAFHEKLDGTLIILDFIDGKPHFRTRGSHDLGAFEEPVMRCIQ